jgi:hypothetical protein
MSDDSAESLRLDRHMGSEGSRRTLRRQLFIPYMLAALSGRRNR